MCQKGYAWKAARFAFENGKYLGSIIDGSVIMYDKIIKSTKGNLTKTTPTKSTP